MLKILEIKGLRGFATTQSIRFAHPRQKLGSGLTILVGANNAGKSTLIEAISALTIAHILDGNYNSLVPDLSVKFPNFHFFAISC
ncbi:AAA family ATPase [Floridanema evergladense]|uniref:AAA family ATPase n=1 Tax=Floridaenema evergladense BLCC-F167 TaxID=3153639 RepID=A0ABV4WNM0_9CYAN